MSTHRLRKLYLIGLDWQEVRSGREHYDTVEVIARDDDAAILQARGQVRTSHGELGIRFVGSRILRSGVDR